MNPAIGFLSIQNALLTNIPVNTKGSKYIWSKKGLACKKQILRDRFLKSNRKNIPGWNIK